MRRDRRIIHLYDKPLYPRPRLGSRLYCAPGYKGDALLASIAITVATGGFLWIYAAIAHGDDVLAPTLTQPVTVARPPVKALVAPAAPAPDMHSPAVLFANADVVVPQQTERAVAKLSETDTALRSQEKAEVPARKKITKVHAAKRRVPNDARRFYAFRQGPWAHSFFQPSFDSY